MLLCIKMINVVLPSATDLFVKAPILVRLYVQFIYLSLETQLKMKPELVLRVLFTKTIVQPNLFTNLV